MKLLLNVYEDETLVTVKRVAEADRLKIPYRVAISIISSLENVNIENNDDLIKYIGSSMDKVDKIIKATFGVTESELDCVDASELGNVAVELYGWAVEKIKGIKGNNSKNVGETV